MIELKQVTKEYGRATVLKNITLTLEEPGDGRAEALLLACGFRLAEENTHGALYVPL